MGDRIDLPMRWVDACRLVANELGIPAEDFAAWVEEARAMTEATGHKWLTENMWRAARKRLVREGSPHRPGGGRTE